MCTNVPFWCSAPQRPDDVTVTSPAYTEVRAALTEIGLIGATLQPNSFLRALDQEVAHQFIGKISSCYTKKVRWIVRKRCQIYWTNILCMSFSHEYLENILSLHRDERDYDPTRSASEGAGGVLREECLDTKAHSLRWVGFHTYMKPQSPKLRVWRRSVS